MTFLFQLEMLAQKIGGPQKWDEGGFANLLLGIENCYTEVGVKLKGNWFSVFVELGVKGR